MSAGLEPMLAKMIFVLIWIALWWITGAVDLGVTSFLPIILLPLLGILKTDVVARQYMEHTIFLFIGGFILGYAMEKWNVHNRIAYRIILATGHSPARILAGIMLTSYLISMWMSNTATTLMLVASVIAIVRHDMFRDDTRRKIAAAFLIGLSYSSTIGGMTTLVGTPTNMIFAGYWEEHFGHTHPMNFLSWSMFAFPLSATLLVLAYFTLRWMFLRKVTAGEGGIDIIREQYKSLGPVTFEQRAVMIIFGTTAVLWFTRSGFDFGSVKISGWETFFPKGYIRDSTVAMTMALLLFVFPSKSARSKFLLEWQDILALPFRIILLFGAGFALAEAFEVSGLGNFLAQKLEFFRTYPFWFLLLMIAVTVTVLSEFASNVASITLMLPVLSSLALAIDQDPMVILMAATIAASYGFMMPVATAPNTIAFSSGHITAGQMMQAEFVLKLLDSALLVLWIGFRG